MLKRGNKNRGFTLIEIIVVLVILAILAAFTIPAMLGFIKRGQEQKVIQNASHWYTASETVLVEMYANGTKRVGGNPVVVNKINERAEAPGCTDFIIYTNGNLDKTSTIEASTLVGAYYKENGIEVTYYDGIWHVGDNRSILKTKVGSNFYTIKSGGKLMIN